MPATQRPILALRAVREARVQELYKWARSCVARGLTPLALVVQGEHDGRPGTFVFAPDRIPDRPAAAVALRNLADFLLGVKPPVPVAVVEAPKGG